MVAVALYRGLASTKHCLKVVLVATYTDSHREVRRYALASLVAFTLLATAMFKVWPSVKYYGLISNLSVAGGLAVAATL